jgi:hypothetical protein
MVLDLVGGVMNGTIQNDIPLILHVSLSLSLRVRADAQAAKKAAE